MQPICFLKDDRSSNRMHVTNPYGGGTDAPSAPAGSPFSSSPYQQHLLASVGGVSTNYQQQYAGVPSLFSTQDPPMATTGNRFSGHGVDPYASGNPYHIVQHSTTPAPSLVYPIRTETVVLDLAVVVNDDDKRAIQTVNKSIVSLTNDVPLFKTKTVNDISSAYKVVFTWDANDSWWFYDSRAINDKILTIPGVQTVHHGYLQIVVIVEKTLRANANEEEIDTNATLSGTEHKDPVLCSLYKPSTDTDVKLIQYMRNTYPRMAPIQKGLMYEFMRNKAKEAQLHRRETIEKSRGIRKRKKR
jgi:hypothetical protein